MRPSLGGKLPEIPAAIASCADKTPGSGNMVINVHILGQDPPAKDLQQRKDNDNNERIKIPAEVFARR